MEYQVILLAAGRGSRSNLSFNKVLYKLADKTIFEIVIEKFVNDQDCSKIVVTYKDDENIKFKQLINSDKIIYVMGGKTRQGSVYNALKHIESDYVLVHDAARPNFTLDLLNNIKEHLNSHDCVIPVIDISDSIKKVVNNIVVESCDRTQFKFIQTPQGFKTSDLKMAHELAIDLNFTDDSAMIEKILNKEVYCIPGEGNNKKYTNKEDF